MNKEEIRKLLDEMKIEMWVTFIPYSKSRSYVKDKKVSGANLNYQVVIAVAGRRVLETDYSMGQAYCPSYKPGRMCVDDAAAVAWECENGKSRKGMMADPDIEDVMHALLSDASAIDYADFADFCFSTGCNFDSRKDEACYKACVDIGLKLRAALGDAGLRKLQEAYQDY